MPTSTRKHDHFKKRQNRPSCFPDTLVLRTYKAHGAYDKGTAWTIPEHELDKALAAYRKQNGTFKSRIKKGANYITAEDAENIIRLATYGVIRLELVVRPVYIPSKPYYL